MMVIELVEGDESRVRWNRGDGWHYADIDDLIRAYESVRHGRWLSVKVLDDEADFGEVDGAECLICGYTYDSEYWAKTYFNYCPNCGAKMDEVEDG